MESRLAQALADREAELARIREDEHAEHEAELDALRRQMHDEMESERERLAKERAELEALRAEVSNATERLHRDRSGSVIGGNERSSGLGQLEDVDDGNASDGNEEEADVSEIKPSAAPTAQPPDMSALLAHLEQKQESALATLRDMVVKEIAAVRDQVSHTEDSSKQATSELGSSLAQRLEGLQSMLMQNQLGGKSKARSVSLPKLDIPPPPKHQELEHEQYNDSFAEEQHDEPEPPRMPTKSKSRSYDMEEQQSAKRNGPPLSIITAPPEHNEHAHLGMESDWPIISRHLRTHKHISLPYAPWIKSAMPHPPVQVIQMREQIAADLRRALTQRGVTTEALNDPEAFESLVNASEQEKEDMHARDACFGPMYEIIWDDMEALTAKQFRFKPKPVMSPNKTTRFTPAIRGTTLAPGSNWRKIVSPSSPARGVLKSVLRSSMAKSPSTPTRRVDWNSPKSPESDVDSDSDDSDKGVAQKAKSAFKSITSRSPGNSGNSSSWGGVRGATSAISNLRSPFASLPNRQSASAGPSTIGGNKSAFPMKSSPLRRGFPSAESPIPEETESESNYDSPSTAFRSSDYAPLTPKTRERHRDGKDAGPSVIGAKRQTAFGNSGNGHGLTSPMSSPVGARSVGFASVVSAAQSTRGSGRKSRGEQDQVSGTDEDDSHSEVSPPQKQPQSKPVADTFGLRPSGGSGTGSGSRLIRDKPGLNHVEVSSDESSYVAAPSRQPASIPKKTAALPEPETADSSGIGQLLNELVSDDEAAEQQQEATRPPPIVTRVIETKPAHNFSEWDVESV
ncbi:hypothetical protein BCR44DRAFT_1428159 [Catenaria anguillulae PL171]|uniref:Uncharacterized protein n=1 Tax=Catenaria anguillulae PL171 TaxID=765915 RepID=A0A1Y2I0P6_9FUNG|nr:hypothetical protein BCR44DRAFT_1428159 [Catenaria anguillulae PL171]